MATIQTKLGFNIRKKISTSKLTKSFYGKENSNKLDDAICKRGDSKKPEVNNCTSGRDAVSKTEVTSKSKLTGPKKRVQTVIDSESSDSENSSSPPKRDRLSSASDDSYDSPAQTPSRYLTKLRINSPAAACCISQEKHLTPKRLFNTGDVTYQHARQALHSAAPTQMPGREDQLRRLHAFLDSHLRERSSGTLYVSGPPGTGKTACVAKTLQESQFKAGYKCIYINCTSIKSSGSIYERICDELNLKVSGRTEKAYLASIERYWTSNIKMILLVLDEIDQLDSQRQAVLYTVFEWPSRSKLVLVGIANTLDLTDRTLPRLQARLDLRPTLMHFPPYLKQEIVYILSARLKEMDASEVFSPIALQLLAGKVAAMSGDVRRALDIGRRVLELAESQKVTKTLPLRPTTDYVSNTDSPKKSPKKTNSPSTVDLKMVMEVLNSVYGTSQSLGSEGEDSFPLQQKVMVCSLVLMLKKGRNKDITLGKLHDVYRRVCTKRNLLGVDQSEFLSLCQLVETRGIISLQTRKEARLAKVSLQWDEEEVAAALKDKQMLAAILNDVSCLSR